MTSNAIAYQKYLEEVRHNKEMEAQGRENIILGRSNIELGYANVGLGYSNLYETNRSNLAREGLDTRKQSFTEQTFWPQQWAKGLLLSSKSNFTFNPNDTQITKIKTDSYSFNPSDVTKITKRQWNVTMPSELTIKEGLKYGL